MGTRLSFSALYSNLGWGLFSLFSVRGVDLMEISSNKFLSHMQFAKKEPQLRYQVLTDIFAVDFVSVRKRFQLNYILVSLRCLERLRLVLMTDGLTTVASVTKQYLSANWLERECWDMFGLFFEDHCDLRRILTDYGFEGYPLRKDFPVTGYLEVYYDDELKRVCLQPLKLTQEFRNYEFKTPWEND